MSSTIVDFHYWPKRDLLVQLSVHIFMRTVRKFSKVAVYRQVISYCKIDRSQLQHSGLYEYMWSMRVVVFWVLLIGKAIYCFRPKFKKASVKHKSFSRSILKSPRSVMGNLKRERLFMRSVKAIIQVGLELGGLYKL